MVKENMDSNGKVSCSRIKYKGIIYHRDFVIPPNFLRQINDDYPYVRKISPSGTADLDKNEFVFAKIGSVIPENSTPEQKREIIRRILNC